MKDFAPVPGGPVEKGSQTTPGITAAAQWKGTYIKCSFEALCLRAALSRCGIIKAVWRRAEKPPAWPGITSLEHK